MTISLQARLTPPVEWAAELLDLSALLCSFAATLERIQPLPESFAAPPPLGAAPGLEAPPAGQADAACDGAHEPTPAAATADAPVPAATADAPAPAATADAPVPAATADAPVPAATADAPVPAATETVAVEAAIRDLPASMPLDEDVERLYEPSYFVSAGALERGATGSTVDGGSALDVRPPGGTVADEPASAEERPVVVSAPRRARLLVGTDAGRMQLVVTVQNGAVHVRAESRRAEDAQQLVKSSRDLMAALRRRGFSSVEVVAESDGDEAVAED